MKEWIEKHIKQHLPALALAALIWLMTACGPVAETVTPTPIQADPGPAECDQRVLVEVWGDLNGDGVPDPDEPMLADVLLMITKQENPTEEGIQLSTGDNGRANFPTRELENCLTTGHQLLFLRQVAGYEFPAQPVVNLDDFDPLNDAIHFGLLPVNEDSN
ncbi:MAG: hypothetical protein CL608_02655 [Anaerolineaceae bacterium]|nr:hypothetical protein [Anaerolineaceae bacterium]